jgi:Ca2+-transporting ATPase
VRSRRKKFRGHEKGQHFQRDVITPNAIAKIWKLSPDETLTHLDSRLSGLSEEEAWQRLAAFGPNRLMEVPPRPAWRLFLDQFRNLLVGVLMAAVILAGVIGDLKDAVVILVVVLFNALLGFYQEYRAETTLATLKKMLAQQARVRRGGQMRESAAEALVPGDIVLLEAGDRVPADGRIVAAHGVEIDESALTGESHAVTKQTEALAGDEVPLAERVNCAFMNTVVTRGRLEMVVSATGMNTEMGRLAGMLEAAEESPTPLQVQLDDLGKRLAVIAGVVVGLIFVAEMLRQQPLVHTVLTAIALAVAAIPEGLPAVVTVTLALGMHRMARNRAIVKKLAVVETLGCTTVICSDKTGTLTLNQMTARAVLFAGRHFDVSGEGYGAQGRITPRDRGDSPDLSPLLLPAALCNDSSIRNGELVGDPTEGALLALAAKGGIDAEALKARTSRIGEIPFDSAHKFMATFHRDGERVRMYLKGAPDVLLARCTSYLSGDEEAPLTENLRAALLAGNDALASAAMRVLAVARRDLEVATFDPEGDLFHLAEDLTFVGLIGIIDPPRPEARAAIGLCQQAGIAVKMITGDHKLTASAIARELGLHGEAMTGAELERLEATALAERIEEVAVFARVAPEHKVKIVKALKARGHVVAMTGDGVNDAPALKNADIGVAMGITGTEVTKEAATRVLTDDNFATIVGAVQEGRTIYDNIVTFVRFQLSTNIGAILTVVGASLFGLPIPFTAIQILWVNIILDGPPAMTLGVEPARPDSMLRPPRPSSAGILDFGRLGRLLLYGAIMAAGTLFAFVHGIREAGSGYGSTLAFTTFVLFQFFNVFNARAEYETAFNRQFFSNGKLWLALAGVVALQALAVHWPLVQSIFHTTTLTLMDWGLATGVASSVLLLEEVRKLLARLVDKLSTHAFFEGALPMTELMPSPQTQSPMGQGEAYVRALTKLIRFAVRILAGLMVLVIGWGVADVVYSLFRRLLEPPAGLLGISDILASFGLFLAVAVAIQIFIVLVGYLRDGVIHLHLVLAAAYVAMLQKIIVLDFKEVSADYVFALRSGLAGLRRRLLAGSGEKFAERSA